MLELHFLVNGWSKRENQEREEQYGEWKVCAELAERDGIIGRAQGNDFEGREKSARNSWGER